ncbi:hypothetical protein ABIF64_009371 [Bradyrhizobium japonicum]|uniref:ABC transporter substrate-binding protein n=1 Tax=Bradyrhizobium japonicum TaxID=375 RepID=A0ABV2RP03_BRAJP|nr:DUF2076 domain-containing protein [Bradyrhizobium japonicum]MCS3496904.1 hypothetical protein [Bradyrhizobium japonicum]MCS3960934.1 hypothetical protein [Bradyrhizobium japonicum]MCS4002688.1 hypothetical protein [Bradyrhizobium japonicum]UQD98423.1 DUF2076 domain-containing protein [Bradyrhizobium japonicum]WLB18340.1 DUF2076 domain-containing protein [Bradyrhizobium japonicum]
MTPQERQLVDELFDRLSKLENAPRDPDAIAAISDGLRKAPGAVYALVQTTLLQDEALKRAHNRIQELEAAHAPEQAQSGGFLDTMRDSLFGGGPSRGSVPNVPPREQRPVWNTGQAMPQTQPGYGAPPPYGQAYGQGPGQAPGQGYGAPPMGGGGGSFLGTAAAAAAGVVGGSLLLSSIRGMMGGSHQQAFGDTTIIEERGGSSPWGGSDQSGGSLARDAGVNDIGSNRDSRQGFTDQASNDRDNNNDQNYDDNGNMDMADDDSDFGGGDDGGSDYA